MIDLETIHELNRIKTEMEVLSSKMISLVSKIDGDIITIRNDPSMTDLWYSLCNYHRKAMLLCAGMDRNKPEVCTALERPQACVEALCLSKEEVCCTVFKRRLASKERERYKARYLMSAPAVTTNQEATIAEITMLMKKHRIGSLVVVDKGKIKGIITKHDLISKVYSLFKDPKKTLAKSIMTRSPIFTIKPEADIKEAVKMMSKHNIKHLPVIKNGNLIGMIAVLDLYEE